MKAEIIERDPEGQAVRTFEADIHVEGATKEILLECRDFLKAMRRHFLTEEDPNNGADKDPPS